MAEASATFSCESCNRNYTWKPELAGKRVKCKCGHVMTVREAAPMAPEEDALFDLAPDPEPPKPKKRVPLAPMQASEPHREPARAPAAAAATALPYQRGPTAREAARESSDVVLDMQRDIHAPAALLVVGFALYVGYYAFRYGLGGSGVAMTGIGLGLMTAIKAGILVGFAFVVAGPLGVSFGGVGTAALKLAAIAVFADGVCCWVDFAAERASGGVGGGGIFGFGIMSFPIALGIYWVLLIYLFSMDSGDSWMLVMILAVLDQIIRTALAVLLLSIVLSWGGVAPRASVAVGASPSAGGGGTMSAELADMKAQGLLQEAREFIAGGRQEVFAGPTNQWYAAGCSNVWFEVSRDFNGKMSPVQVIVELPKDKSRRAICYEVYKKYLESVHLPFDEEDLVDDGEPYLEVPIR